MTQENPARAGARRRPGAAPLPGLAVLVLVAACGESPAPPPSVTGTTAALDPAAARRHAEEGRAAGERGDWPAAIAHLKEAVRLGPYDERLRYALGSAFVERGDPDEAIAYYRGEAERDPKPQTSLFFWAVALVKKGELEAAGERFRSAVEVDPAHELSWHEWGEALELAGRDAEALERFDRAVRVDPDFAEAHLSRARVLERLGRADEAAAARSAAARCDPDPRRKLVHWGRALLEAGRPEAAAVELRKAVEALPASEEARRLLERALRESGAAGESPDLERLRAIGYASWDEGADETLAGVTVHDPAWTCPGYGLYTNDVDEVYLIDLDGRRLHTWRLPGKRNCQYAELRPDGTLLAISVEQGFTKLAWDSTPIWEARIRADHDFAELADGSFLVRFLHEPREYRGRPVIFDGITRISPAGKTLDFVWWSTWSALDELRELHPPSFLDTPAPADAPPGAVYDYHHLNTVEVLPDTELGRRDPRFRAGNVLLCLRNVDLVLILDGEDRSVVWSWGPGVLDNPHMPTLLPDGHLLVYDNGRRRGWTRVLELEPVSGEVVWSYRGDPPESFFSELRGSNQRLPNGNTLIAESERGRAFEVTPDGVIVWEFWAPDVADGRRKRIYRMQRLPPELVEPLLAQEQGR